MQKYTITISNGLIAETTTENGDYYLVTEVDAILAEKDKMIAAFMGEMDHDQKEAEYLHEQIATLTARAESLDRIITQDTEREVALTEKLGEQTAQIAIHERDYETVRNLLIDARAQIAALKASYYDLIMGVENKYPSESRHEIAKRFIQERQAIAGSQHPIAAHVLVPPRAHICSRSDMQDPLEQATFRPPHDCFECGAPYNWNHHPDCWTGRMESSIANNTEALRGKEVRNV